MANTCITSYRIVGRKNEINDLYEKLLKLRKMKEPLVENGWGILWLGCLITILDGNWKDVHCRGRISDFDLDDDVLIIYTETAWAEMSEVRYFLEKVYPGLKIYYYEEEPGSEIYQTNDKHGHFFTQKYVFDDHEGEGMEYFDDSESLLAFASEAMNLKLETIEDLNDAVSDSDGFSFHEIKVVND
jgi:hypothetical protein